MALRQFPHPVRSTCGSLMSRILPHLILKHRSQLSEPLPLMAGSSTKRAAAIIAPTDPALPPSGQVCAVRFAPCLRRKRGPHFQPTLAPVLCLPAPVITGINIGATQRTMATEGGDRIYLVGNYFDMYATAEVRMVYGAMNDTKVIGHAT